MSAACCILWSRAGRLRLARYGLQGTDMNTNVDPRSAAAKSNAPKQDLRAWLAMMEAAGEVTHISGAEREREIGGIVDIYQRKIGNPLVLFDDIPGYPKGHRILANLLTSIRRIN